MGFGLPSLAVQLAVLALGVVVVGMPHGALDHRPARRVLSGRWPRAWPALFVVAYLVLVGFTLLSFDVAPRLSLALFLLGSILHFGLDAGTIQDDAPPLAQLVAWGAPPIVLPMACSPAATAQLFSWVCATPVNGATVGRLGLLGVALWIGGLALDRRTSGLDRLRLMSYLPLFLVAPPLVGFGVFFCLDHAPRHLRRELTDAQRGSVRRFGLEALPATGATLLGMFALGWLWRVGTSIEETTVRVLFRTLAALTLPHMVLAWLDARRNRPTHSPVSNADGLRPIAQSADFH